MKKAARFIPKALLIFLYGFAIFKQKTTLEVRLDNYHLLRTN